MENLREKENAFNVKIKCMKIAHVFLCIVFSISSLVMISGGNALKILCYYGEVPESFSKLNIAIGCLLLAASVFGIMAVLKESTCMTNFYGAFLSLIFILNVAAAIIGFFLAGQAYDIGGYVMDNLMTTYFLGDSSSMIVDWIQRTFRCCGGLSPDDWKHFRGFSPNPVDNDNSDFYSPRKSHYPSTVPDVPILMPRLPQSCCKYGSWDPKYKICQIFFTDGCTAPLRDALTQIITILIISVVVIGFHQIVAIVCAFIYARMIRRNKTNRALQRWTLISQSMETHTDQFPTPEPHTDA